MAKAIPNEKQLQRNIIIAIVTAVIIALIAAWLRRNRETLTQIPIVGDTLEFVLGSTDGYSPGKFSMGGINLGDGPTIVTNGRDFGGKRGFDYPPANTCGCGGSASGPELVSEYTEIHTYAASAVVPRSASFNAEYVPPPCFERLNIEKLIAKNGWKVNTIFKRDNKGRERARAQGYADTPKGLMQWAWDAGLILEDNGKLYYNRGKDMGMQEGEGESRGGILDLGTFFRGLDFDAYLGNKQDYMECM